MAKKTLYGVPVHGDIAFEEGFKIGQNPFVTGGKASMRWEGQWREAQYRAKERERASQTVPKAKLNLDLGPTSPYSISAETKDMIRKISAERGVTSDELVRIALKSLSKPKVVRYWGLHDVLDFGRYKGETLETVIKTNPSWVLWALNTIDTFEIDEEALPYLSN